MGKIKKTFGVCWNTVEIKSATPFRKMTSKQIDDAMRAEKERRGDFSPLTEIFFEDLSTAEAWYNRVVEKLNFRLGHGARYTMGIDEAWIDMITKDEAGEVLDTTTLCYDRARICL